MVFNIENARAGQSPASNTFLLKPEFQNNEQSCIDSAKMFHK